MVEKTDGRPLCLCFGRPCSLALRMPAVETWLYVFLRPTLAHGTAEAQTDGREDQDCRCTCGWNVFAMDGWPRCLHQTIAQQPRRLVQILDLAGHSPFEPVARFGCARSIIRISQPDLIHSITTTDASFVDAVTVTSHCPRTRCSVLASSCLGTILVRCWPRVPLVGSLLSTRISPPGAIADSTLAE